MKKFLFLFLVSFIGLNLFSSKLYACINSNCQPCPDGFLPTYKCCKETSKTDCVLKGQDSFCREAGLKGYTKEVEFCCNTNSTECSDVVPVECPKCEENMGNRPRRR